MPAPKFHPLLSRPHTLMTKRALFILLSAAMACALKFTLKGPNEKTTWRHRQRVWVTWEYEKGENDRVSKVDFDLFVGQGEGELIENISFGVPLTERAAEWVVAKELPAGREYFVKVSSTQDKGFKVVSPRFGVNRKGGARGQASGTAEAVSKWLWSAGAVLVPAVQLLFW